MRRLGSISSGMMVRITSSLPRLTTVRRMLPALIISLTSLDEEICSPLMLMMTSLSWSPALSHMKKKPELAFCSPGQDKTLDLGFGSQFELIWRDKKRARLFLTLCDPVCSVTGIPQGCVLSPLLFILFTLKQEDSPLCR